MEPRFRSANQSFPCYQTRQHFNICQQIKPAEGPESSGPRSTPPAARRVRKKEGGKYANEAFILFQPTIKLWCSRLTAEGFWVRVWGLFLHVPGTLISSHTPKNIHIRLIGDCIQEPVNHTSLMRNQQAVDRRWMDLLTAALKERWVSTPSCGASQQFTQPVRSKQKAEFNFKIQPRSQIFAAVRSD